MSGYNLWNPPPWRERQQVLKGIKFIPGAKIDAKQLEKAMEENERRFAGFRTPVTAETLNRMVD